VFPARYELNSYIVFRKRLVSKRLNNKCQHITQTDKAGNSRQTEKSENTQQKGRSENTRIKITVMNKRNSVSIDCTQYEREIDDDDQRMKLRN
jgi:hypothetical protein